MSFKLRRTPARSGTPAKKRESPVTNNHDYDDEASQSSGRTEVAETWEVERVMGKRLDDKGELSYLLKWKSYDETSWEPLVNLSCDKLIKDFEDKSSYEKWRENSASHDRLRSPGLNQSRNVNGNNNGNGSGNYDSSTTKRSTRRSTRR